MNPLNHTHDIKVQSWLASANVEGCDFPIQNLPYAVLAEPSDSPIWRAGVAIGDQSLDLAALQSKNLLTGLAKDALEAANMASKTFGLNALMAKGPDSWQALRHALFALLSSDAPASTQTAVVGCLIPLANVIYRVPSNVGNYTDFYTSIHHARNTGRIFKPDAPLSPNFVWLPIAYHGRNSSVVISGTNFKRPWGQSMAPGATAPVYDVCKRMDYELEMGFYIGTGNAQGAPVALADAEAQIFGMCLLNDWSARDHQFWEMAPLGPFLGKNFCTSVSPWIVTMEALTPFRAPAAERPAHEPQPLLYLNSEANQRAGGVDVQLSVSIESEQHRAKDLIAAPVSRTSFRHQYWTIAQMVTQHTVGGCNLQSGDLLGTGTISGPTHDEAGSIVEQSKGGSAPITLPGTGEQRAFLHDGDSVILRGWCERAGATRIGFGECRGMVLPALAP